MGLTKLRYTVTTGGGPKKILSIALQPSRDLIVDLKPAEGARPDANSPVIDGDIEWRRTTVHHSSNSKEGNLITHTAPTTRGKKFRAVQFTRAIKTTNRFAPILHRRFPDISYNWEEPNGGSHINLGKFDSSKATLIMSIYVSARNRPFASIGDHVSDMYLRQDEIGSYRTSLIYGFLGLPSIVHGSCHFEYTMTPGTCPSAEHETINEMVMNGYTERDIALIFYRKKIEFTENYFKLI